MEERCRNGCSRIKRVIYLSSKDLCKKFLAVAFCIVFRAKEGERNGQLLLRTFVDGRSHRRWWHFFCPWHSDHVRLSYLDIEELWREGGFHLDDSCSFQFGIIASDGVIVSKCGFRLICKPLEDDLEALYQDDQSLDPGLLYEIWHDDKQTTTEEESLAFHSYKWWRRHEDNNQDNNRRRREMEIDRNMWAEGDVMADFSVEKHRYSKIPPSYKNILPRGDIPKEFVPVEGGTISFMVSQDFYDKFLGLALCVVFSVEDGQKGIFFNMVPHVNGQRRNVLSGSLGSFDSDQMWIQYLKPNMLWGLLEGAVNFLEFDEDYLQFKLTLIVSGRTVERLGYVLICEQLDDDLKVALEGNQLVDPASLCEIEHKEFFRKFLPRRLEELEACERLNKKRGVE